MEGHLQSSFRRITSVPFPDGTLLRLFRAPRPFRNQNHQHTLYHLTMMRRLDGTTRMMKSTSRRRDDGPRAFRMPVVLLQMIMTLMLLPTVYSDYKVPTQKAMPPKMDPNPYVLYVVVAAASTGWLCAGSILVFFHVP